LPTKKPSEIPPWLSDLLNVMKNFSFRYKYNALSALYSSEGNNNFVSIYQTVDNLHLAVPKNLGDWYFTGNYPTPGGNKVANKAFMNFVEKKDVRAY